MSEEREFLTIGLPIEVDIRLLISEQPDIYFSQIMDVDAERLLISSPQRKGRIAAGIGRDDSLGMSIMLPDATYSCLCRVLGWQTQPDGLKLSLPIDVKRTQRRSYVRVDAVLPVILNIKQDSIKPACEPDRLETSTTDISGGGMMVSVSEAIPLQTRMQGRLFLPPANESDPLQKFDVVHFEADVCRCEPHAEGFLLGLSYPELEESRRDKIIKYIFRYQRESIQNKPHLAN